MPLITDKAEIALAIDKIVSKVADFNPSRIILFGSQVNGSADQFSDVDLLVVFADQEFHPELAVEIRESLRGANMPVDLFVISESELKLRAGIPGSIYFEAATQGIVRYGAP